MPAGAGTLAVPPSPWEAYREYGPEAMPGVDVLTTGTIPDSADAERPRRSADCHTVSVTTDGELLWVEADLGALEGA